MSFRRAQKPTFSTLVTVPVPDDKGGFEKNTFTAFFKRTTHEELVAITEQRMTDADIVRDRLVGWRLTDADTKEDVPFSAETLEAILEIQPSPKFIAKAFFEAAQGGKA